MKDQDILAFAISLAKGAAKIILGSSREIAVIKKGRGNFATKADLASEQFLIKKISRKFPGHDILSEETKKKMNNPESRAHLWILDPLDGTSNFFYGIPFFCISVAYAEYGKVVCGVVYDPLRRELFSARSGRGAFLDRRPLKIARKKNFSGTVANVGCPYDKSDFEKSNENASILYRRGAKIRNFGSSVLETVYVAAGRFNFYCEWGPKPWDAAASKLIVEEAGGTVELIEGESIFDFKGIMAGPKNLVRLGKSWLKLGRQGGGIQNNYAKIALRGEIT